MFFDFFRKRGKIVDVTVEGEQSVGSRKNKGLILIIIAAIIILAFGNFGGTKEKKSAEVLETAPVFDRDGYERNMESRLEKMLTTVKGAGKVRVMVTFEEGEEKILASNKSDSRESDLHGEESSSRTSGEESIMTFGSGTEEQPYVVKERLPIPTGVLVTAEGAANESVRLELYEAVRALYGISGHRIKITASE